MDSKTPENNSQQSETNGSKSKKVKTPKAKTKKTKSEQTELQESISKEVDNSNDNFFEGVGTLEDLQNSPYALVPEQDEQTVVVSTIITDTQADNQEPTPVTSKDLFTAVTLLDNLPANFDISEEELEEDEEIDADSEATKKAPAVKTGAEILKESENTGQCQEAKNSNEQQQESDPIEEINTDKLPTDNYTPLGDTGKKFKYIDYPHLDPKYVDLTNNSTNQSWTPDTLYQYYKDHDVSTQNEQWRKDEEENYKNFVSKYQHTDPNQPNYIDLNDQFFVDNPLDILVNPFAIEDRLDRAFVEIAERNKKNASYREYVNGGREKLIDKIVGETIEKEKKYDRHQYVSDQYRNKDRMTDKDAKLEYRERFDGIDELTVDTSSLEREEGDEKLSTPLDWWDAGLTLFQERFKGKLQLYYTGEGKFGGIEFVFKACFRPLPGLPVPAEKYIYRSIKNVDRTLMKVIGLMPKDIKGFWLGCFSGDANKSAIAKFANIADMPRVKPTSIDGNLACKMIPPKDWFDERIQGIDPKSLLGIFPSAEADTLLLHIGRTALGLAKEKIKFDEPNTSNIVELPKLKYDYRIATILHGSPGTGKSTLIENLLRSFYYAGYSTAFMGTTFNQFGWDVISQDLVVCDELNALTSIKLLSSDKVKSAISGNSQVAEKKGIDGKEVQARASFIYSTNEIVFPKDFDRGIFDRMHFLQTYSKQSLMTKESKGENCFISTTWNKYALEHDTTLTVLGLWLIRCGLDEFLKELEVTKTIDESGQVIWNDNSIERMTKHLPNYAIRMENNRRNYVFQVPVKETEYLPVMGRKAVILAKLCNQNIKIQEEFDQSFSAFTLMMIAETHRNLNNFIKKELSFCQDKGFEASKELKLAEAIINWICDGRKIISSMVWHQFVINWTKKVSNSGRVVLGENKNTELEPLWQDSIANITTIPGRVLDNNRVNYEHYFNQSKVDQLCFVKELEDLASQYGVDFVNPDKDSMRFFSNIMVNPIQIEYV